jgi:excisionase family DNA binding protein
MSDDLVTVKKAAAALGVSENTVRKLFDAGRIGGFKTPGGHRRIYLDDVTELSQSLVNDKFNIVYPSR